MFFVMLGLVKRGIEEEGVEIFGATDRLYVAPVDDPANPALIAETFGISRCSRRVLRGPFPLGPLLSGPTALSPSRLINFGE